MPSCVGDFCDAGSRSSFYIIDEERGFKEFESQEDAEYAHAVQSKLAEHSLAPRVLSAVGKIRYRHNLKLSDWGYMSEVAEMMCCGGNEGCENCEYVAEAKSYLIERLCKKINDLGFEFMDAHVGNIGYVLRKGKDVLVCIDCGKESVYDDTTIDEYEECDCEACKAFRNQ